jgi:predicted GNAT family acetyltransferase
MPDQAALEIRDNQADRRFEALVDGEVAGWIDYRPVTGRLILVHTEVRPEFGGRGIGGQLASGVLDGIRTRGLLVTVHCPFVAAWIRAHPGYQDLVIEPRRAPLPPGADPRDPDARRELR